MNIEDNAELEAKLNKLSDRKLTMFSIWEIRSVRKLLDNHLRHHEERIKIADGRRFKIYLLLIGCFLSTAGGLGVALLVVLL